MGEKEINISYETLFELLRREKNRDELQKLNETFFYDVAEYIKDKEEFLEHQKNKQDLFASEEKEKAEKQIINLRKILKELYAKRERKIIEMAIDASRTDSAVINTASMLDDEKKFYNKILGVMQAFRKGILMNIQSGKKPELEEKESEKTAQEEDNIEKPKEEIQEKEEREKDLNLSHVKFTHAVPRFVGPDLKEYGPFEEGDAADLPLKIADILVNKGRAE